VSTAISDRHRNFDEDTLSNRDTRLDSLTDKSPMEKSYSAKKDESHMLFELVLDPERPNETIRVYDNEDDYEAFLD